MVSVFCNNNVEVVPGEGGGKATASYVSFQGDQVLVGDLAKARASRFTTSTVFHLKRMLGRKYDYQQLQAMRNLWPFQIVDHDGDIRINIEGRLYSPTELISSILGVLKKSAEEYLGRSVINVIATIPAHFDETQRLLMKAAFTDAGLHVLMFVMEPTAAALTYNILNDCNYFKYSLVFDLGGGTFDLALLESKAGLVNVLAIDGDPNLGGEDFDNVMMEHCIKEFQQQHQVDLFKSRNAPKILTRLRQCCEREKRVLTYARSATIHVDSIHGDLDMDIPFTLDQFNELINPYLNKCMNIVERLLEKFPDKEISQVVLVGGSSRIPKIRELLKEKFGGKLEPKCINPEEAVVRGAAILGSIMRNTATSKMLIQELGKTLI